MGLGLLRHLITCIIVTSPCVGLQFCMELGFFRVLEEAAYKDPNAVKVPYTWQGDLCGVVVGNITNPPTINELPSTKDLFHEFRYLGRQADLTAQVKPVVKIKTGKAEQVNYSVGFSGHHKLKPDRGLVDDFVNVSLQGTVREEQTLVIGISFHCLQLANGSTVKEVWFNLTQTNAIGEAEPLILRDYLLFLLRCNEKEPLPTVPPKEIKTYKHEVAIIAVIIILAIFILIVFAALLVFEFYGKKRWCTSVPITKADSVDYGGTTTPFDGCLVDHAEITIGREIGKGAFGIVYEGTLRGESVAIKTMKGADNVTEEQVLRFLEEAVCMKHFNHPNILNLVGVCFQDDVPPQIICPFMEKGDLHTFLRAHDPAFLPGATPLPVDMLYDFAVQVALGMHYLSKKNFVHRDLAARNCMLGQNNMVKVGDFGLGRDIQEETYYRVNTEFMLPVKWMALESLQFYKFTLQSDVWSYGVVLWELMTCGQVPYPGVPNYEILEFLKSGNRLLKPERCPDKMYELMLRCWRPVAQNRPTFPQILEHLKDIDLTYYSHLVRRPIYQSTDTASNTSWSSSRGLSFPRTDSRSSSTQAAGTPSTPTSSILGAKGTAFRYPASALKRINSAASQTA